MDDATRTFERLRPRLMIPDAASLTPEQMRERVDDLCISFLTAMEELPPETRTAFLLSEMFDVEINVLAQIVGKSEAECRQMVETARTWLRRQRPRYATGATKY